MRSSKWHGIRGILAVLGLLLLQSQLAAHDLWLVPPERSGTTETVFVRANSEMDFPKSERAPDPSAFVKRVLMLPGGSQANLDAAGTEDLSGLLRFTPENSGLYIVAVETKPKVITLDAGTFNEYLVADGLPHIYRLRAKEKTLDRPGRERYSKSPKAIIQVGAGGGGDASRVLGLPLEIVPLRRTLDLKPGDTLKVRVLFRGEPLAEANLGWDKPSDGDAPSGTVRTDPNGEALLPISQTGLMTVRLTHMTRPKEKDYEWESFWTTLTFRIPASRDTRPKQR